MKLKEIPNIEINLIKQKLKLKDITYKEITKKFILIEALESKEDIFEDLDKNPRLREPYINNKEIEMIYNVVFTFEVEHDNTLNLLELEERICKYFNICGKNEEDCFSGIIDLDTKEGICNTFFNIHRREDYDVLTELNDRKEFKLHVNINTTNVFFNIKKIIEIISIDEYIKKPKLMATRTCSQPYIEIGAHSKIKN